MGNQQGDRGITAISASASSQKRTHRPKDRVFCLSPEIISLFCMLIAFSIEHHLKPIRHHCFASSINN